MEPRYVYPVPQNALHVSSVMNPVRSQPKPRPLSYGVNVPNLPEGHHPNPVPHSPKVSSAKPPEATTWYGTKATEVSPWYGVYLLGALILWPALSLGQVPDFLDQVKKEGGVKSLSKEIDQLLESENLHVIGPEGEYSRYMKLYNEILAVR